jgi:hypothetical protein
MSHAAVSAQSAELSADPPKSFFRRISLSKWIIIAMVVGIIVGWAFPNPRATHRGWAATVERAVIRVPADDQIADRSAVVRHARLASPVTATIRVRVGTLGPSLDHLL